VSTVTRWFSEFSVGAPEEIVTFQFPTRDIDPAGGVDRHSGVFVSVTELSAPQRGPADFPAIGAASIAVRNVAAADDGTVKLWLTVAHAENPKLHVRLQFLVSND
jgi:hypothetical protein